MSYRRDVEDRMENPNLLKDLGINQPVTDKVPMSPEEWEKNKSCELKNRTHKYKWDPERPGTNWAQCVHCGAYHELDRKLMDGYDVLGIERK